MLTQNDLVNEVFPPVARRVKPEFSDFNYWRNDIPDIPIPNLSPPSPALSARSDSSMLSKIIGNRRGLQRPSSPLSSDTSDDEGFEPEGYTHSRRSSMPGAFDDYIEQGDVEAGTAEELYDDDEQFDDDILAAGEMRNVPF
jgi:phosphatidate phosphatase LPIN